MIEGKINNRQELFLLGLMGAILLTNIYTWVNRGNYPSSFLVSQLSDNNTIQCVLPELSNTEKSLISQNPKIDLFVYCAGFLE